MYTRVSYSNSIVQNNARKKKKLILELAYLKVCQSLATVIGFPRSKNMCGNILFP